MTSGKFIWIEEDPDAPGKWRLVTAVLRGVLGPRLQRSEPLPTAPTSGLTMEQARASRTKWEAYVHGSREDRKRK